MSDKEIKLESAAFQDSEQARSLTTVPAGGVKKIVEAFLECAYLEHGSAPRKCDGHDMHAILGHLLPSHFKKKDPLAEHVPAVLAAYLDFLEETQVVSQAYELRRGLEGTTDEFLASVREGRIVHHHGGRKQEPVVHKAEKTGRNDPCVCGSGKKFKKCCGKGA